MPQIFTDASLLSLFLDAAAIVLAIGGYILASYFYLRNRSVRKLTFEFKPPTLLDLRSSALSDKLTKIKQPLRVLYGDREVQEISIVEVKVANTGTEPALSNQITIPITFDLGGNANIIDTNVVNKSSSDVSVHKSEEASNNGDIKWIFDSLEKDEFFEVQYVAEGRVSARPSVKLRMPGFEIETIYPTERSWSLRSFVATSLMTLAAMLLVVMILYRPLPVQPTLEVGAQREWTFRFEDVLFTSTVKREAEDVWKYVYAVENMSSVEMHDLHIGELSLRRSALPPGQTALWEREVPLAPKEEEVFIYLDRDRSYSARAFVPASP